MAITNQADYPIGFVTAYEINIRGSLKFGEYAHISVHTNGTMRGMQVHTLDYSDMYRMCDSLNWGISICD